MLSSADLPIASSFSEEGLEEGARRDDRCCASAVPHTAVARPHFGVVAHTHGRGVFTWSDGPFWRRSTVSWRSAHQLCHRTLRRAGRRATRPGSRSHGCAMRRGVPRGPRRRWPRGSRSSPAASALRGSKAWCRGRGCASDGALRRGPGAPTAFHSVRSAAARAGAGAPRRRTCPPPRRSSTHSTTTCRSTPSARRHSAVAGNADLLHLRHRFSTPDNLGGRSDHRRPLVPFRPELARSAAVTDRPVPSARLLAAPAVRLPAVEPRRLELTFRPGRPVNCQPGSAAVTWWPEKDALARPPETAVLVRPDGRAVLTRTAGAPAVNL
jgi:hypothetical protein